MRTPHLLDSLKYHIVLAVMVRVTSRDDGQVYVSRRWSGLRLEPLVRVTYRNGWLRICFETLVRFMSRDFGWSGSCLETLAGQVHVSRLWLVRFMSRDEGPIYVLIPMNEFTSRDSWSS